MSSVIGNHLQRRFPETPFIRSLLEGLPECEWLEVGYRLDITGTVLQDAFVLLRVGNRIAWLWQINGNEIDEFPIQLPFMPPSTPEPYVFKFESFV